MERVALYREWRPQSFGELIGQEHVSRTLKNAVAYGSTAHAYLFCGPRGTGKTSTARILAKALNCAQVKEGEPCNRCESCLAITGGNSLDVIEMDAASHRGIEEIRELKQKVGLAPGRGHHKVYIIDEVHMLTGEAFNALLKTLEEPPAGTVFILATTEANKVPPTILSRCQRFDFRRLGVKTIARHLAFVAGEEGWQVEEEALLLLSRRAGGAMRDALGLLEQAASFGNGRITRKTVETLTGAFGREMLEPVVASVWRGDVPGVLAALDRLYGQGAEARQILYQLVDYARERLFVTEPEEQMRCSSLLRGLAAAEARLKESGRPDLILELALLRQTGSATGGGRTASQQEEPAGQNRTGAAERPSARRKVREEAAEEPMAEPTGRRQMSKAGQEKENGLDERQKAAAEVSAAGEQPAVAKEPDQAALESLRSFLRQHYRQKPLLSQVLSGARLTPAGSKVLIQARPPFDQMLKKESNLALLREGVALFSGGAWRLELGDSEAEPRRGQPEDSLGTAGKNRRRETEPAGEDGQPLVSMAVSLFKGRVINIKEEGD